MSGERVLDIGIGRGGAYFRWDRDIQRVGLDVSSFALAQLKASHPGVRAVLGTAERLPFASGTFSRLDITLPDEGLLYPGLQSVISPYDEKDLRACVEEYLQNHPFGLYGELSRVLKPDGILLIRGDFWVWPHSIVERSKKFFELLSIRTMTIDEFRDLGTATAFNQLRRYETEFAPNVKKLFENELTEIILRKRNC